MFKVVLSPLTNRIYCGKSGRGTPNTLIGKEDVTCDAFRQKDKRRKATDLKAKNVTLTNIAVNIS